MSDTVALNGTVVSASFDKREGGITEGDYVLELKLRYADGSVVVVPVDSCNCCGGADWGDVRKDPDVAMTVHAPV